MNYADIIANTADRTLTLTGGAEEIVKAFRMCKLSKAHELKGKFRLAPTDKAAGLNIRKSKLDDANEVYRVFEPFADALKESLALPFFDDARKTVVSTNGWAMLFCEAPEGLTLEQAKRDNFCTDANVYPNWTNVLMGCNRENTPYALADFKRLGEVEKGGSLHNILTIAAYSSRAFRHDDSKGFWHNLYLWVGENQYDPVQLLELVRSLFRLGCGKVGFYYPEFGYSYKALHLVGFGDGLNARGLLMPMRFPTTDVGGIEFPLETNAAKNAA